METIIVILFALLGVTLFILAVVASRQAKKARERREVILQTLANKLGGRILPDEFTLHFLHSGMECRLVFYPNSSFSNNQIKYTCFLMLLESIPPFFTQILQENLIQNLTKSMGFQDIQVGDADFDPKFMIKGDNETRVRQFLSQPVREAILRLEALSKSHHIEVAVSSRGLRIEKLTWLDSLDLLEAFIEQSLLVADGFLAACHLTGPTESTMPATTPETCAVCDDELTGTKHSCPSCGASHHPECWILNDGCGSCGATDPN